MREGSSLNSFCYGSHPWTEGTHHSLSGDLLTVQDSKPSRSIQGVLIFILFRLLSVSFFGERRSSILNPEETKHSPKSKPHQFFCFHSTAKAKWTNSFTYRSQYSRVPLAIDQWPPKHQWPLQPWGLGWMIILEESLFFTLEPDTISKWRSGCSCGVFECS